MNKHCHRLVFNARRRQIMAVAESASGMGNASSGERSGERGQSPRPWSQKLQSFALHPLTLGIALVLAMGLVLSASARAQIIADPSAPANQRATVHSAPNGVPLVNIQTPTAAGVSRNTYRQFDVQSGGAILNNSRTQVQTQLGGWVQGNPWLAAGPARVIVNEVNSSHPSLLSGYVEVAGQRAQVIFANPSGIQVQGGGFINAGKATLTTGQPVWRSGNLDGFRVRGGTIRIDGSGLDTSSTDYTVILARAVEVNAGIWAQDLKVVTGVNDASADMAAINANPADAAGSTPAYALDVAQLGGMYAGKIHLIGTEAGVGVNLRGVVGATSGDVVIEAGGWLHQQGTLQASGQVRVQAQGELHNAGDVYSGTHQLWSTERALINTGRMDANGTLEFLASSLENRAGAYMASSADLRVRVDGSLRNQGDVVSGGQLVLRAHVIGNSEGQLTGRHLDVESRQLNNHRGSIWQTGRKDLQLTLGDVDNSGGRIGNSPPQRERALGDSGAGGANTEVGSGAPAGSVVAPGATPVDGSIQAQPEPGSIRVSGQTVNEHGIVAAEGMVNVSAQSLLNRSGAMYADRIDVRGATLDNTGGRIAARHVEVAAASLTNVEGAIEGQTLRLDVTQLDNTRGLLGASNSVNIVATGRVGNAQGDIQSLQANLDIKAGQLSNSGRLRAAGHMKLQVDTDLVNTGLATAQGDAVIVAGSLASSGGLAAGLRANGELAEQGNLRIETSQTLQASGLNLAAGGMTLTGKSVVLTNTMNNWAVIGQDCDFFGCDPVYGWASAPYAETIQRNVALGSVRYEQGVQPQAPGVQPGTFSAGNTQAQAHAAGVISQAPGGAPNAGPALGTPLPGMSSAPPIHAGIPAGVRIGVPNLSLPSSALFQVHPGSTGHYLVETDPRFADRRQWLSSDYMLAALSVDPATVQKRMGDGFYEQRLVREQVYVQEENKSSLAGSWMMRSEDIKGLSPEQIASKYALPQVPTHMADVAVPSGQTMRVPRPFHEHESG